MKVEEFFKKYANLPIGDRFKAVDIANYGLTSFQELYKQIHDLEDQMRPMRIRQNKLLEDAERFFKILKP